MPSAHRALCFSFCLIATAFAHAQSSTFAIYKGDEQVGSIAVSRVVIGERTSYSMISHSRFNLLWDQEVRTTVRTHYLRGRVNEALCTVHHNDALRDSSHMRNVAGGGLYFRHPSTVFAAALPTNAWTTARMYYEEPVGQDSIFVESALKDCPMERFADGEYRLTLPNKDRNHYIYREGRLQEIRVDRGWFALVFRRKA